MATFRLLDNQNRNDFIRYHNGKHVLGAVPLEDSKGPIRNRRGHAARLALAPDSPKDLELLTTYRLSMQHRDHRHFYFWFVLQKQTRCQSS